MAFCGLFVILWSFFSYMTSFFFFRSWWTPKDVRDIMQRGLRTTRQKWYFICISYKTTWMKGIRCISLLSLSRSPMSFQPSLAQDTDHCCIAWPTAYWFLTVDELRGSFTTNKTLSSYPEAVNGVWLTQANRQHAESSKLCSFSRTLYLSPGVFFQSS